MTRLDEARALVFSLPDEEQAQLNHELSSKLIELPDEETQQIEATLQSRLNGPFEVIEDIGQWAADTKAHYRNLAATMENGDA